MKIITDFFLIIIVLLSVNNVDGQKDLRIGYINMEYILSNIQDFEIANKEFDYKIEQWKNEIFEREKEIKTKRKVTKRIEVKVGECRVSYDNR